MIRCCSYSRLEERLGGSLSCMAEVWSPIWRWVYSNVWGISGWARYFRNQRHLETISWANFVQVVCRNYLRLLSLWSRIMVEIVMQKGWNFQLGIDNSTNSNANPLCTLLTAKIYNQYAQAMFVIVKGRATSTSSLNFLFGSNLSLINSPHQPSTFSLQLLMKLTMWSQFNLPEIRDYKDKTHGMLQLS